MLEKFEPGSNGAPLYHLRGPPIVDYANLMSPFGTLVEEWEERYEILSFHSLLSVARIRKIHYGEKDLDLNAGAWLNDSLRIRLLKPEGLEQAEFLNIGLNWSNPFHDPILVGLSLLGKQGRETVKKQHTS